MYILIICSFLTFFFSLPSRGETQTNKRTITHTEKTKCAVPTCSHSRCRALAHTHTSRYQSLYHRGGGGRGGRGRGGGGGRRERREGEEEAVGEVG